MECSVSLIATTLLLSVLCVSPTQCQDDCLEYLRRFPSHQTVAVGENVTFSCELKQTAIDEGVEVSWIIVVGGNVYTPHRGNLEDTDRLHIFFHDQGFGTDITVTVGAISANNNSQIKCRVDYLTEPPYLCFVKAELVVVGPPLPPTLRLTVVNATHLNLSWDPPFLLAGDKYPIEYYQVQVTDSNSNEVLEDEQVDVTYKIYSIPTVAETCKFLSFNVTATTLIGTSMASGVEGGFPIVPGPFNDSAINLEQVDSPLSINLSFELPEVCSYHPVDYTVALWENQTSYGGNAVLVLQINGTCCGNCSQKRIDLSSLEHSRLTTHRYYWIEVIVSTEAGSSRSAPQHFQTVPATETIPATETTEDSIPLFAIGAAVVVGVVLILAFVLSVVSVCCFKRWRAPTQIFRVAASTTSVNNPIYQGSSQYEELDGYQNNREGAYALLGPPALPPPRVKDPAELSTSDVHKPEASDEYVVMNSAQPGSVSNATTPNAPVHPRTKNNYT